MKHLAMACVMGLAATTAAADQPATRLPGDLTFSLGVADLRATELVYGDKGERISQLDWRTRVPVLSLTAAADLGQGFTLQGRADLGIGRGQGEMTNRDWLEPFATGSGEDDWTHWSHHPDTRLDRYIHGEIALGRDLAAGEETVLNLHGGLHYTRAEWSALGGDLIYSRDGFRDVKGRIKAGLRNITYQQSLPGAFLGLSARTVQGKWTLTGKARVGLTIEARDRDYHWLRNVRFDGDFSTSHFAALGLRADYRWQDHGTLWVSVDQTRYVRQQGDVLVLDRGEDPGVFLAEDGGGFDFRQTMIGAGVEIAF